MKLTFSIKGLDDVTKALTEGFSARRLTAAAATALTRTARAVADDWRHQLGASLDRPTRATLGAVRLTMATASNPVAEVSISRQGKRTDPVEWIGPHELGVSRKLKKFEKALQSQGSMPRGTFAVPGPAAKLDTYGNVSRAQIVQVIAQLGAKFSPGYQRVISPSASKRAAKALAKGRGYIAITERNGGLAPGVYTREGRQLRAVFYFVGRTSYSKRLNLVEQASRVAAERLQDEVARALTESAGRLAARGGA